ncbi:hypothetical protein FGO68_gene10263 [Halteria grandinella]|uniref:Uncharacterized protein n=1 Tax=Halteria grandinella TaxID=5974 RepID=A0A8J8P027_HALGN|nr:hypothetical protein FGO68_gene10263 [Halteria grandinella]
MNRRANIQQQSTLVTLYQFYYRAGILCKFSQLQNTTMVDQPSPDFNSLFSVISQPQSAIYIPPFATLEPDQVSLIDESQHLEKVQKGKPGRKVGCVANKHVNYDNDSDAIFQMYLVEQCGEEDCEINMKMAISVMYYYLGEKGKERYAKLFDKMRQHTGQRKYKKEQIEFWKRRCEFKESELDPRYRLMIPQEYQSIAQIVPENFIKDMCRQKEEV